MNQASTSIPILVALGANLPGPDGASPVEICRRAVVDLDRIPGLKLRGLSQWYESAPIPPSGQPPYVNGVALLIGGAEPAALLAVLQGIEQAHGRVRSAPNAARTLDLDLIGMGAMLRRAPDPILPHPRAHERGFVLAPLAEVAPGWVHPGLGLTAAALLARLPPQAYRAL
jgi:2-amino-4-hydroxy-6-hydroxymethyldihydropteridine diphosphokinase